MPYFLGDVRTSNDQSICRLCWITKFVKVFLSYSWSWTECPSIRHWISSFDRITSEEKCRHIARKNKVALPIPGVEPGPPGWKPGILTARPYGKLTPYWLFHDIRIYEGEVVSTWRETFTWKCKKSWLISSVWRFKLWEISVKTFILRRKRKLVDGAYITVA